MNIENYLLSCLEYWDSRFGTEKFEDDITEFERKFIEESFSKGFCNLILGKSLIKTIDSRLLILGIIVCYDRIVPCIYYKNNDLKVVYRKCAEEFSKKYLNDASFIARSLPSEISYVFNCLLDCENYHMKIIEIILNFNNWKQEKCLVNIYNILLNKIRIKNSSRIIYIVPKFKLQNRIISKINDMISCKSPNIIDAYNKQLYKEMNNITLIITEKPCQSLPKLFNYLGNTFKVIYICSKKGFKNSFNLSYIKDFCNKHTILLGIRYLEEEKYIKESIQDYHKKIISDIRENEIYIVNNSNIYYCK